MRGAQGALPSPIRSQDRIWGALLLGSLLVGLCAMLILIAGGVMPAFGAMQRGSLAELAPYVAPFRASTALYAVAWVTQLLGFALLTSMLIRRGDEQLAIPALVATIVAAVLGILEATFATEVIPWAARETAATGAIPSIYIVLDRWHSSIQTVYIAVGLVAQAGYGGALLRTGLLPAWVGSTTLAWAVASLVVLGLGIPAALFVMPGVIGAALLWSRRPAAEHPSGRPVETVHE